MLEYCLQAFFLLLLLSRPLLSLFPYHYCSDWTCVFIFSPSFIKSGRYDQAIQVFTYYSPPVRSAQGPFGGYHERKKACQKGFFIKGRAGLREYLFY